MNYEFKGTPGPWGYTDDNGCKDIYEMERGKHFVTAFTHGIWNDPVDLANAKLISKAPEMFEMLKKAAKTIQSLKLSMLAHPDCTEGSEFDDYTTTAQEMEDEIDDLLKQATE